MRERLVREQLISLLAAHDHGVVTLPAVSSRIDQRTA
jgi:hypothetical protein